MEKSPFILMVLAITVSACTEIQEKKSYEPLITVSDEKPKPESRRQEMDTLQEHKKNMPHPE